LFMSSELPRGSAPALRCGPGSPARAAPPGASAEVPRFSRVVQAGGPDLNGNGFRLCWWDPQNRRAPGVGACRSSRTHAR
jgi:hypothetical protein